MNNEEKIKELKNRIEEITCENADLIRERDLYNQRRVEALKHVKKWQDIYQKEEDKPKIALGKDSVLSFNEGNLVIAKAVSISRDLEFNQYLRFMVKFEVSETSLMKNEC